MSEDGRTYPLLGQAKTLAHEPDFRAWLSERGLSGRSLGDVVSRVRRVVDWLDVLAICTTRKPFLGLHKIRVLWLARRTCSLS